MEYSVKFYKNIIKYNMINKNDEVVVACSGGADSIFLLHNMNLLKDKFNLKVKVCHVNHGVRDTAKRDQQFVEKCCKKLNLPFYTIDVNMDQFAKDNGLSSEEAGRKLRYDFFRKIGTKIFTAHNMDDQAETVLFRIIRGTGIDGLAAMEFQNNDIYRPMLNISRKEIEEFLSENKIDYVEDETNQMPIYSRNKIRLELIPYVENNLNSGFKEALLRLQDLAVKQNTYFKKIIDTYLGENLRKTTLNITKLKSEDDYIISLVIKEYLKTLNLIDGVSKNQIESIVEEVKKDSSAFNVHMVTFEISQGFLSIKNDDYEIEDIILHEGINNTPFGIIELVNGYKNDGNFIHIDGSKIQGVLKVRNRRKGDRFVPYGMKGTKKLKDFFIDEKIPRHLRNDVAIVVDDKDIIWVAPYRISDNYKVSSGSGSVLSLRLEVENE